MKSLQFITGMVASAVAGGALALAGFLYVTDTNPTEITEIRTIRTANTEAASRFADYRPAQPFATVDMSNAAEATVHSVVHVKTTVEGQQYYQVNPLHYFFFGEAEAVPRKGPDQKGSGSGVVISEDGYIVTNNHVVSGAKQIEVTLNDNRSYPAEIIGTDPSTDLALLKINESKLEHVSFGNSDEVRLGEWVLAVGNPYNLTSTVTAGIVSAKGRNINILNESRQRGYAPIESFIQTDAAVNPGNSGGALVNTNGELIGINTAIKSPTGTFTGYSFAVPVNIISKVIDDLIEYGSVQRAFIGVSIRNMDNELAEELELKQVQGVYVNGLTENGAAADAGIEEGDIIVQVEAVSVNNVPELQEQIGKYRPGDQVNVTLLREEKVLEVPVVLRNRFGNTDLMKKEFNSEALLALGAQLSEVSEKDRNRLRIANGVQVKELDKGKLREAGMREGFIITRVDKNPVTSPTELKQLLENKQGGVLIEGIYPNGVRGYYGVGM